MGEVCDSEELERQIFSLATNVIEFMECYNCMHSLSVGVRVKRGYGVKYAFRLIQRHIRVLPDRVKRGYGVKYTFRLFQRHIRVLPDLVKRGYGVQYTFRLFKRHIRVLPDRVKRGYGIKYTFRLIKRHIRCILGCAQLNRVRWA
jgi:hypothetical protein